MEELVKAAESYVSESLINELPAEFLYHNLTHTQRVVKKTMELIEGEEISEKDANHLILAAWFHDIGYKDNKNDHEKQSADIAKEFLTKRQAEPETIEAVVNLIMATEMEHDPTNMLEMVIRERIVRIKTLFFCKELEVFINPIVVVIDLVLGLFQFAS